MILQPGGFARLSFATGAASDRETARALAQKYHDPGTAARAFAMAYTHSQMVLRHLGITSELARQYDRLASRVLYLDESLRAEAATLTSNTRAQESLWVHGVTGDLPILLVKVVEDDDLTLVRQVLQAGAEIHARRVHEEGASHALAAPTGRTRPTKRLATTRSPRRPPRRSRRGGARLRRSSSPISLSADRRRPIG